MPEQRFRLPSAINCGESLESGTVGPLADGLLFCIFLAKLSILFSNLAGMVKSFLNLFVHFLEWAQGLLALHALILRRSLSRAMPRKFKQRHYEVLQHLTGISVLAPNSPTLYTPPGIRGHYLSELIGNGVNKLRSLRDPAEPTGYPETTEDREAA